MPVFTIPIHEHGTPGEPNYPHPMGKGASVEHRGQVVQDWQLAGTDDGGLGGLYQIRAQGRKIMNGEPVSDTQATDAARVLLDAAEPIPIPLYRGTASSHWLPAQADEALQAALLKTFEAGTTHDLTLTSFTSDAELAKQFAAVARGEGGGIPVTFILRPGGRAVDVAKHSLAVPDRQLPGTGASLTAHAISRKEKEHIVVGSARVVRVTVSTYQRPGIEYPNPQKPWEYKRVSRPAPEIIVEMEPM